jgi:cytochrome P450
MIRLLLFKKRSGFGSAQKRVHVLTWNRISQLVHDILSTPDDFYSHIKRTTASIASIVIFGFRARSSNSFWAAVSAGNKVRLITTHMKQAVYKVVETVSSHTFLIGYYVTENIKINSAIEPGSYLPVAQFPILRYIPDRWNPGKARAKQCNQTTTSIWTEACQRIEKRRKDGVERPSLADKYFSGELKPDVAMSSSQFANFCGTLHGGASDTTASAMLTNILHLAKYPWVQDKATDELDRICGADRAPTWADFKDLPYINCIIKEGLRIRPV